MDIISKNTYNETKYRPIFTITYGDGDGHATPKMDGDSGKYLCEVFTLRVDLELKGLPNIRNYL